jgi:hypothetical protein
MPEKKQKYWIRCPVCGKKSLPENFKQAGKHRIGKQKVYSLGKGKGFKNVFEDLDPEDYELIKKAVEKALKSLIEL